MSPEFLKSAGAIWGLVYFVIGAIKSFTLNSNDTWASVAALFGIFLLPLPITIIAVWFKGVAGKALLACVAVNLVAASTLVVAQRTYPLSDVGRLIAFVVLYNLPHLFFGVSYIRAERVLKKTNSSNPSW